MNDFALIGICGGTGAGKSTLVSHLQAAFPDGHCTSLRMDNYYKDFGHLTVEERSQQNFDSLESVDVSLFENHLHSLASGNAIDQPQYDFETHTRRPQADLVTPAPIIFVDGLMLLMVASIRERLDLAIYIDLPSETRLQRRIQRDTVDRGRSIESVVEQWEATVDPFHATHVEASKQHADLVLQTQDFQRVVRLISGMGT